MTTTAVVFYLLLTVCFDRKPWSQLRVRINTYFFTNKTIPISALIVRQLKMKDGDKLDWEFAVEK